MSVKEQLIAAGVDPALVEQMMAEALVSATVKAKEELAKEQAAEEEAKAVLAAKRAELRQKRASLFADVSPFIGDLVDAVQGCVEPEDFTKKGKDDKGADVVLPAGSGWKFSGEHTVTLDDGTVTTALVTVGIVYGDTKTRRVMSVPAAIVPHVLEGVSA